MQSGCPEIGLFRAIVPTLDALCSNAITHDAMKNADKIILEDLVVMGRVGHTPEERAHLQKIWIDVELTTDTRKAAKTDDIAHAVDYVEVAERIQAVLNQRPYNLAERVADQIAAVLLREFPIRRVKLRVKKKTVPNAAFAIVQIVRDRL